MHFNFFMKERSMEAALQNLLPKMIPARTFDVHVFESKRDLLNKLPNRLRAYKNWISCENCVVVLIDQGRQDCREPKNTLENIASACGFPTIPSPDHRNRSRSFHVF